MSYEFSFLFPVLLVIRTGQLILQWLGKSPAGWRKILLITIISIIISAMPVGGIPLARWLISLNANFCIPLTAILFAKVWEKAGGKVLFNQKERFSFGIFGLLMGLLLYPMALGLGSYDPYALGWDFSFLFVGMMVLTILLLLRRNRLGIVLIICILTYQLRVLESHNFWDYLIDPFYVIGSFLYVLYIIYSFRKSVLHKTFLLTGRSNKDF